MAQLDADRLISLFRWFEQNRADKKIISSKMFRSFDCYEEQNVNSNEYE